MKKIVKIAAIAISLLCTLLLCTYSSAYNNSQLTNSTLDQTDITPPIIIFDTSLMSTGVLMIAVYDFETNLSYVTVTHNGTAITDSTFERNWYYDNTSTPPFMLKNTDTSSSIDETAPIDANTFEGWLYIDNYFEEGDHNSVSVEAGNEASLVGRATLDFCNQVECWGRGGTAATTQSENNVDDQVGVPDLRFDMEGFYCCGQISPWIDFDESEILNFTITLNGAQNRLSMSVFDDDGYNYIAAVIVEGTIEFFGGDACDCGLEGVGFFLSVAFGLAVIVSVTTVRKRKKRV